MAAAWICLDLGVRRFPLRPVCARAVDHAALVAHELGAFGRGGVRETRAWNKALPRDGIE